MAELHISRFTDFIGRSCLGRVVFGPSCPAPEEKPSYENGVLFNLRNNTIVKMDKKTKTRENKNKLSLDNIADLGGNKVKFETYFSFVVALNEAEISGVQI